MIFLELVPTEINKLINESHWAMNAFAQITGINVPDILQINNRSYTACEYLAKENIHCIPHIRICDFSTEELHQLCQNLLMANVQNILLISGDPPPNPLQPVYKHNSITIIKELSTAYSSLSIYAGHNFYRQSFKEEFVYSQKKLDAGAKGLFTQPVFDVNFVNILLDQCHPCEWFIGISPVLTEKSYNYWTSRNNVVFPSHFNLSLDYNIKIAKDIIHECKQKNQHNYIMPITCKLSPYLDLILNEKNS